ncbi:hypothetical protein DMH03_00950 [Amycolatopsis sp. WAC 01376]|uniref:DUF3631 domain-containing protein n=1 Tax=Amycolatopsis sp. WAC 01376 TaxID=2203195 RepID=UPI000F7B0DF9|nr:DUF3631 domain-containing protein [Amycolatopsis sp. WAC 01376]RSM65756.1 hypothetical protein DMH03_00950 [Amycolatopsis sp. WAC 01376]
MTVPALRVVSPPREPTATSADGAEVLDQIGEFVSRFNVFPSEHCAPMLALWYAHTHAAEHFYITPRLILSSAEPGSGKTRVLEVAQYLVASPEMTLSASPAALFRLVSAAPITILFDEVDAIFNPKNTGNTEDLRALLNAGYKRSATIPRCVGDAKAMAVQRFKVYAPAALAGIAGHMPDTITTRAITVHMRRRAPGETVEPFKTRRIESEAEPLRDRLADWVRSVAEQVGEAEPEMPDGVTDRSAEIWEPLLALADAAGGDWPEKAREACKHFVANNNPRAGSIGTRLLADLRDVFTAHQAERLPTTVILESLHAMEEGPWADYYGKPFDARHLSKELGRYGVEVHAFKHNGTTAKGYRTTGETGLADAWTRYLPPPETGDSR